MYTFDGDPCAYRVRRPAPRARAIGAMHMQHAPKAVDSHASTIIHYSCTCSSGPSQTKPGADEGRQRVRPRTHDLIATRIVSHTTQGLHMCNTRGAKNVLLGYS
eukprot:5461169-Prymnesium_polylepis.1